MSEKRYLYVTPQDYEIAESNGISKASVYNRVYCLGWDVDKAINEPVKIKRNRFSKWKDKALVSRTTFLKRLQRGWTEKEAALIPPQITKSVITEDVKKLAESNGINENALRQRVFNLKWDIERATTTPLMSKRESAIYGLKVRYGK